MRKIKVLATKEIQDLHPIDAKEMVSKGYAVYADGQPVPEAVDKIKKAIEFAKIMEKEKQTKAEEDVNDLDDVNTEQDVIKKPFRKKAKQTNDQQEGEAI